MELGFGPILGKLGEVAVDLLPSGLSPRPMVHVLRWETLAFLPVVGFLVGLVLIVRLVWSVRSGLAVRREAQLAKAPAKQMEEESHLIDKHHAERETHRAQGILRECQVGERSLNTPSHSDTYRKVTTPPGC